MKALALLLLLATPALAADISGSARVIDGDTLAIGDTRIRLWGIDAREMNTAAGRRAKAALDDLVTGTILACVPKGKSWNRVVAICYLPDGRDVARVMVDLGYAQDWPRYSGGYYAR